VAIRGELAMWTAEAGRAHAAKDLAAVVPAADWATVTWGDGTKGPLTAHVLALRVRPTQSRGERWWLCERDRTDETRKFYLLKLEANRLAARSRRARAQPLAHRIAVSRVER
jgi:hypothetical protein